MAIALEFICIIVPRSAIENVFPKGLLAYRKFVDNGSYYEDEHLTRAGFMSTSDAESFVVSLESHGIQPQDIAVVTQDTDSATCWKWLEIGVVEDTSACWHRDYDPGELLHYRSPSAYACPLPLFSSLPDRISNIRAMCPSLPVPDAMTDLTRFHICRDNHTLNVDAIYLDRDTGVGLFIGSDFGRIAGTSDPTQLVIDFENLLVKLGATPRT